MKPAERHFVLLLSILSDGRQKNLTGITSAFEAMLKQIGSGYYNPPELSFFDLIESQIKLMRQGGLVALADTVSYKYQITEMGRYFLRRHRAEMEKYLGIKL